MRSITAFIVKMTGWGRHDLDETTSLRGNSLSDWIETFRTRYGTRKLRHLLTEGLIKDHTAADREVAGIATFIMKARIALSN